MYRAREDLEANIAELKHAVQEKVDVRARARVAVEKGKIMASDAYTRGKEGARHIVQKGEDKAYFTYLKAKDRPVLTASIIGGVIGTGVLAYAGYRFGYRRCWW
jgi:hypothetical protein